MAHFFLFQLFEGWSWSGIVAIAAMIISGIILLGTLVKAFKDIRADGWMPFKERWINPWRTRRHARENLLSEFGSLRDSCDSMGKLIGEILKEVKPNGGTSLKDRVIGIDDKVENIVAERRHQNETSDTAIFKLDSHGEIFYTNATFRELVNAEDDQLIYNNYLSLMEDDDRRRFIRSRDEAIQFKMPLDCIVKFKLHGPHFISIRLQASPDVRHEGALKGFFGTATKIEGSESIHLSQS